MGWLNCFLNTQAPGPLYKPRRGSSSGRGRGRGRQIDDDAISEPEDIISSNSIDRICDFVLNIEKSKPEEIFRIRGIYQEDPFFQFYINYNQQENQPKYNQAQDLYEGTCENVFSEFLNQVKKKIKDPFFVDIFFLFIVMLARGIRKKRKNSSSLKEQPIQKMVQYVHLFLLHTLPEFRQTEKVSNIKIFEQRVMARLLELFYNWLIMKKYLAVKVKVNKKFFEHPQN